MSQHGHQGSLKPLPGLEGGSSPPHPILCEAYTLGRMKLIDSKKEKKYHNSVQSFQLTSQTYNLIVVGPLAKISPNQYGFHMMGEKLDLLIWSDFGEDKLKM